MSFHSIPTELIDAVAAYLNPNDLVALAQTAHVFFPIAQRLLYRHLTISPCARNLSVVATLARRPDLAHFVRSFAIYLDADVAPLRAFYRRLATALSHMSELTSLQLYTDPSASWVLAHSCQTQFPRLQHFACSFQIDTNVAQFLEKTPALTELELDFVPDTHVSTPFALIPTSIPLLDHFVGPAHAASVIVPGRPVNSVHLTSGDLTAETVQSLALATADVSLLCASTSSQPVPLLESVSSKLPRLAYLRLMTTFTFAKAPEPAFYERIANALNAMPALITFELSGMHWGSYTKPQNGDQRVWQSNPPSVDEEPVDHDLDGDFYADFFVY
ncbi:hypothetical protein HGRIS_009618 [Hohenbuehelia grisea]|uniref:F-box domain-containing protein n=1 Tax=Hohenbuehelia grisea TaxID=104357 RepID=A0ABR3J1U5_9AGAR